MLQVLTLKAILLISHQHLYIQHLYVSSRQEETSVRISWTAAACILPEGECKYLHDVKRCKVTDNWARDCA